MGKVLVVDDEPSVRDIVKTYLEYADLEVHAAGDGIEALDLISRESYDVVISDIQMPKMDGLTLAEEIHKVQPDIAVILMTGYASVNSAITAIKKSVFDYILKPFQNMQIIQQTVARGIERKHMIQEHRTITDELKRTNADLERHRRLLKREIAAMDSELSQRVSHLSTLYNISRSTRTITNPDELLRNIMDSVMTALPGIGGVLYAVDSDHRKITSKIVVGMNDHKLLPATINIDEGDVGETVRSGYVQVFRDIDELTDPALRSVAKAEGVGSAVIVPLRFEENALGALLVMFRPPKKVHDDDVNLLTAIADQVSVSIMNAELYASQQSLFRETVEALATAIDSRDHYTGGHSYMVTQYALMIAEALGFDERRLELIRIAGLMHDVGKIGISDEILNKPGKLTDEEMNVIKSHPILGRVILESIDALKPVAKLVYHHHERYDGKGYPEGISGEDIPLESRILQMSDIFHALTSHRIYRKAMPLGTALKIVRDELGTTFDPEIGRVFLELTKGERFKELYNSA